MSVLYFWLYSLIIAIIWGFFIILRLHSLKYNNFQILIWRNVKILFFILLILTIIWYVLVFMIINSEWVSSVKILDKVSDINMETEINKTESVYY